MKKNILFAVLLAVGFTSCDYVEKPLINDPVDPNACPAPSFPQNTNTRKNVLFEEFTGHTCGNCPGGAYFIRTTLQPQYQDTLILVSVHAGTAGGFADPNPNYPADYRTVAGQVYNSTFSVSGYPTGMINRTVYGSNILVSQTNWANAMAVESAKPLEVNLQMITEYDSITGKACFHVESEFLTSKTGQYNLIVYIVEDSIISKQTNYPGSGDPTYLVPEDDNYVHRHMLRANVGGTWGTSVVDGSAAAGDKIVRSLYFNFNADNATDNHFPTTWSKHHCYVVAYIYDASNYEILQVIEEKLIP